MPAKRIYRDINPENWDHPNAGKVQDAYDRSRQRAARMPIERGSFRDPPRQRPVDIPIDRPPDPRRLPSKKRELPSVKNGGLIRLPAKDVTPPDWRRPTNARGPASRLPGVTKLGRFTPLGRALELAEMFDDRFVKIPTLYQPPPNFTLNCTLASPDYRYPKVTHQQTNIANTPNLCGLAGQAYGQAKPLGTIVTIPASATKYEVLELRHHQDATFHRYQIDKVWHWQRPTGQVGEITVMLGKGGFLPFSMMMPNANAVRAAAVSSSSPAPAGSPAPGASAEPSPLTNPFSGPDLSNADAPGWAYDLASGQPALPRGRTPTKGKNAEPDRKVIPRSKRLAAIIWKALDKVSEGAEKVDCVYEALPENVKKRWGKDRDDSGLNIGGNFGQYGLGGAHWKSEAIWHNFEKVDINKALNCIALNEIEDQIYGAIHAKLPDNIGSALDPAFKGLADILRDIKAATGIEVE